MRTKVIVLTFLGLVCLEDAAPAQQESARPIILIVYYSEGGHTRQMAEAVSKGAKTVRDVEVRLRSVEDVDSTEVRSAAALIVGSPVFNAAVAPQIQSFINSWPFDASMRNKIGAAFTTGGGISAGEELVQVGILHSMLVFGMMVVGGEEWTSAFGASAVTKESPFEQAIVSSVFLTKGEALGRRVSDLVLKLNQH